MIFFGKTLIQAIFSGNHSYLSIGRILLYIEYIDTYDAVVFNLPICPIRNWKIDKSILQIDLSFFAKMHAIFQLPKKSIFQSVIEFENRGKHIILYKRHP